MRLEPAAVDLIDMYYIRFEWANAFGIFFEALFPVGLPEFTRFLFVLVKWVAVP